MSSASPAKADGIRYAVGAIHRESPPPQRRNFAALSFRRLCKIDRAKDLRSLPQDITDRLCKRMLQF
jgi:hypothetical protein